MDKEKQAIENLKFFNEGDYITREMADSKDVVLNLIEKQDKIINLMSEQLTTPIHSKEWVIEYYTKEVEEK